LYAATALWRVPQMTTSILRLTYTLGDSGTGTLANFLKGRRVPMLLGFDPLFHFIHEEDAATAIQLALEKSLRGIFNAPRAQPLPLSVVAAQAGRRTVREPDVV